MICKNCQNEFQGKFCNDCGQKANTRRLNLSYMTNEVFESILQMNHGLLFTVKELSIRPGHSIREFLEGKRKQHFKPLAFLLLASTIYVLLSFLLGHETLLGDFLSGVLDELNEGKHKDIMPLEFINWLANNFAYATLFFLPIFSSASFILFRSGSYNYVEHLVLNIYTSGYQIAIYIVFSVVALMLSVNVDYIEMLQFFLATFYLFWAYVQFFNEKTKVSVIFRLLLTYLLNILLMIIVFVVVISIFFNL